MKNLWFTLLASVVLCGSSFVFNRNGERSVLGLKQEMKLSNLEMKRIIYFIDFKIQRDVSIYPRHLSYKKKCQAIKDSLSQELIGVTIPKTKNEAVQFVKKWNNRNTEHINNFIDKDDRESIYNSSPIILADNFYHSNNSYNSLLDEILKMNVMSSKMVFEYYFSRKTNSSGGLWFCFTTINSPSNLKLKINETSEIPMVLNVSCSHTERHLIQEIWINEQKVNQNKPYLGLKQTLIYNGENQHRVRIKLKPNTFLPYEIQERIYDFKINESN